MKKKLRILVLVTPSLIPPEKITHFNLDKELWRTEYYVISTLQKLGHQVEVLGVESDLTVIKKKKENFNPDIAFNLLEEFDFEALFDHNLVSYLELIKLPYTGCNPRGLMLAKDKSLAKIILHYHRIKSPTFEVYKYGAKFKKVKNLNFPLIVKSLIDEGSTGISQKSIVKNQSQLKERVEFIHKSSQSHALVESYIPGKDLYVSMMGVNQVKVFPFLELEFKKAPENIHTIATSKVKWDPDYRKKYKINLVPAKNISDELELKIKKMSKKIYKALNFSGYARLDLRVTEDQQIFFIEANPNPDIADGDEFAISAARASIKYPELLQKILNLGLKWKPGTITY